MILFLVVIIAVIALPPEAGPWVLLAMLALIWFEGAWKND